MSNPRKNLILKTIHGLSGLVFRSGEGITELAARVHLHFSHLPWFSETPVEPSIEYAPLPYRVVHEVFRVLKNGAEGLNTSKIEPIGTFDNPLIRLTGVINGILGDRLERWDNPLATPFQLYHRNDEKATTEETISEETEGIIVFIHGLCMNATDWDSRSFKNFADDLENNGYKVLKLHYNSGRSIPVNGRLLNKKLKTLVSSVSETTSLSLVGHSMGGLVAVSSYVQAQHESASWLTHLKDIVTISSPFNGAPLEKIGHTANSLLGLIPFTEPFMDLGLIRSTGLRELREGDILPDSIDPHSEDFNKETVGRLLLLGVSLSDLSAETPIGDGMVPLDSSWARDDEDLLNSLFQDVNRKHLKGMGHIEAMRNERVYSTLQEWMDR
ncbi:MAG: esterase/lipase family protein [bacterium]